MRILFLTHGFNSLAQRLFVELSERGHQVTVELDINDGVTQEAVTLAQPDVIIAPFLKRAIPEAVWKNHLCLIVHPGPLGDRGPASLDWAILRDEKTWGVTVLQATGEMDGGPVWATSNFTLRPGSKSSLYRHEVTEAAVEAVHAALNHLEAYGQTPPDIQVANAIWRGPVKQADRAIDWSRDTTDTVLRKINSADGTPGLQDRMFGRDVYLFDAHPADGLQGEPGTLVARCGPAIARATVDGAVWIGHLRDRAHQHPFKLPATRVLADVCQNLPAVTPSAPHAYPEIRFERHGAVGLLHFDFYNGAMGTAQCEALLAAYEAARQSPAKVLVLAGGPEFWSNGLNLNLIEAGDSAADESWRNINAIDDLAEAILRTRDKVTIAALRGNAGAGGVFLARACDRVWLRAGVVLNPHYKDMGNLYGSEFWTYSLPRCAGPEKAQKIAQARLPMGSREALALGLADKVFDAARDDFLTQILDDAAALAAGGDLEAGLFAKQRSRDAAEAEKPLADYRREELARMHLNFYGFDPSYHVARYNFVHKVPKSRTPVTIARHRRAQKASAWRNAS